jgi:hypothetical protein
VSAGTASETTYGVEIRGRRIVFESIWKDEETLEAVAIWDAHELLSDFEALWLARTYLSGPFVDAFLTPYEKFEDYVDMESADIWPTFGDDTARWVRRVWALWRPTTEEEADASLDQFGDPVEAGQLRWVEHSGPGTELRPATVVTLGGPPHD